MSGHRFHIYKYSIFVLIWTNPVIGTCPIQTEHISCNPEDIMFLLYPNPNNMAEYDELKYMDISSIQRSRYSPDKPIKILVHGFTQNKTSTFPRVVKNAYLEAGYANEVNLIVVDWGKLSGTGAVAKANISSLLVQGIFEIPLYLTASDNVAVVGKRIADFLLFLRQHGQVSGGESIHMIGQSLGAHALGIAAQHFQKSTSTPIERITGTDPAGPLFQNAAKQLRLDPSDAKFVQIIHSNQGGFGYSGRLGHVDFFVNGMRRLQIQPGCPVLRPSRIFCSHNLAANYFAASILDPSIKAMPSCPTNSVVCSLRNRDRDPVVFGERCPNTARGIFTVKLKL